MFLSFALVFITLVGFTLTGPYTLPAGALSLSFGGKKACATTSALVDTTGYLGGLLSGYLVGLIADEWGWNSVWGLLSVAAIGTVVVTAAFFVLDHRSYHQMLVVGQFADSPNNRIEEVSYDDNDDAGGEEEDSH